MPFGGKSEIEESFALWLRVENMPQGEREHRFHPTRKWRFDFAWEQHKVAVEIEGLTPQGGRHQSIAGFLGDAEKYEAALRLGWRVYRVPGPWIRKGNEDIWRPEVMETLKELLER